DYTRGTTRTVDSCRGCILQNVDAFNFAGRNLVKQIHITLNAVDDNKGIITANERCNPTNTNRWRRSRLTASLRYVYASSPSGNLLHGVGERTLIQLLR